MAAKAHAVKGDRDASPRKKSTFLTPRALSRAIRAGTEMTDEAFDQFVPPRFQSACRAATPLAVATRATQLLADGKVVRILDVGAGIGKMAIVGALTTGAAFTGVELSLSLLRAARGVALRLGAKRVTFVHGTVADLELCAFDAIYLFDPQDKRVAGLAKHSAPVESCARLAWRKLADARKGTRILTYCGAGHLPGCHLVLSEPAGDDRLTLFSDAVRVRCPGRHD